MDRAIGSPHPTMAHRTRNRVPQYEQVAIPNRSTFVGGPPQFGQLRATGPCWPAGTIGCWIGGGGGILRRFAPWAYTMMKMRTMKTTGTHRNGAMEKAANGERMPNMITPKTPRSTTTRMMPIIAASGGRRAVGAGVHIGGGGPAGGGWAGGGWATSPDWTCRR